MCFDLIDLENMWKMCFDLFKLENMSGKLNDVNISHYKLYLQRTKKLWQLISTELVFVGVKIISLVGAIGFSIFRSNAKSIYTFEMIFRVKNRIYFQLHQSALCRRTRQIGIQWCSYRKSFHWIGRGQWLTFPAYGGKGFAFAQKKVYKWTCTQWKWSPFQSQNTACWLLQLSNPFIWIKLALNLPNNS